MGSTKMAVLGLVTGGIVAFVGRPQYDAWARSRECCSTKHAPAAEQGEKCPAHFEGDQLVVTDSADLDRLRQSLRDGVFRPWVELGRAPTPEEIGARLHLERPGVMTLMDRFEACGVVANAGIRRVPESNIIAVAWPFANVPTGIDVTLEGRKPVPARCAIDALGISKMMGARASVDAQTHEGVKLHVEVDGDKLVSADPPNAIVFKGAACDEMLFFATKEALEIWKAKRGIEGGQVFTMAEAVTRGATGFGKLTAGLPEET
jgi:hypothetical protein